MTPLRQGYPLYNIECQIPDALGNSAFESPHTEVCAPKIIISGHMVFAIFVAKIRWQSNPWIFSQGCSDMPCERDTPIFTTPGLLTSFEEMSNSQCCLGWGLSVGCHLDICTQIYEHGSGWVWISMLTTWSMHCVLLSVLSIHTTSFSWEYVHKTILSRFTMTPLRQDYPH